MILFNKGKDAFLDIISNVENAKTSVEVQMFIWRNDNIGNKMVDALIDALNRGVNVSISKDIYGVIFEKSEENCQSMFHIKMPLKQRMTSWILRNIFYRMNVSRKNSIIKKDNRLAELLAFDNFQIIMSVQKNHTKYFIIDDTILYIGGMNIEDKEVTYDSNNRKYQDYMVKIDSSNEVAYFKKRIFSREKRDNDRLIDYIISAEDKNETQTIIDMIEKSKKIVYMAMAYFGNKDIEKAIFKAVNRNVEVKIVTSNISNVQTHYNKQILNRYVKNGVKVYFHQGLVHAKALVIDDLVLVGSINFNDAGMYKLKECALTTYDKKLRDEFIKDFKRLINESEESHVTNLKYNRIRAFLEKVFS